MKRVSISQEVEIRAAYDVIVAGAGASGICAAVAAAREGAKVALVERYGVVGGNLAHTRVRREGNDAGRACKSLGST